MDLGRSSSHDHAWPIEDKNLFASISIIAEDIFEREGGYFASLKEPYWLPWITHLVTTDLLRRPPVPVPAPQLILIVGEPGTGKSTAAAELQLAGKLPAVCDLDDYKDRLTCGGLEYLSSQYQRSGRSCRIHKAAALADLVKLHYCVGAGADVVWVITGAGDAAWYRKLFTWVKSCRGKTCHGAQYSITAKLQTCSAEDQKKRLAARAATTGRGVPDSVLESCKLIRANLESWSDLFLQAVPPQK